MARAKLYQRLRTTGFSWVVCEIGENGKPKVNPDAFQLSVRYALNGQRRLETFKTLDQAQAALRDRDARLNASKKGRGVPVRRRRPRCTGKQNPTRRRH